MGMLAASWNLHTKVEWSSPAWEVIVKHSEDKYLYSKQCYISVQPLPLLHISGCSHSHKCMLYTVSEPSWNYHLDRAYILKHPM